MLSHWCCKIPKEEMNGYEWKRSSGFGGNLVEEATLDVETLPKVKHLPSLCNERAGKKNCIFSPFVTWQTKGRKSYCVS